MSGRNIKPHDANDLIVFRTNLNPPTPLRRDRDVAFVRPGAETGFTTAVHLEGNTVDLLAIMKPVVIDILAEPQRCLDGRISV